MQPLSEQYDTNDAAPILRVEPDTLRNSRHTGRLAGVTAPRHRKIGNRVFYERETLDKWLEQFEERTCATGAIGSGDPQTSEPQRDELALVEGYRKKIFALVTDLDSGRLRLGSVQLVDEAQTAALKVLQLLNNMAGSK